MIQHVVLFCFPEDLSARDWEEMRAQVWDFPTKIGGLEKLRIGTSFDQHAGGYQYLMYAEFQNRAALTRYLDHPVHLAFGKWATERDCRFVIFDYELDNETVVQD